MKIFDGLEAVIWRRYEENNCNAYLIGAEKRILIDPGHEHLASDLESSLAKMGIDRSDIDVVLVTHGHPDHMEAAGGFDKALLGMGREEYLWVSRLAAGRMILPEPDFFLREGACQIGGETFEILTTPGHSPASICIYWVRHKALFTGDVVFRESVGRSDVPGGDSGLLKQSIQRLMALDVEYLLPGHGEPIMGKEPVQKNFQAIADTWFQYL